jgi:HPt (histidine-containing phosphotransfer) domain-containing protein
MDPLNLKEQADEIGIDRETLLSLYYVFIKQTDKDLAALRNLISEKNLSDLREMAHHIKGASLNLEISAMAESARLLFEESGSGGDWGIMEEASRSLDRQFRELKLRIAMEEKSGR